MANFQESIAKINADYDGLEQQAGTGSCWKLSTTMQELEGALREHIQDITKDQIAEIIKKLEANAPLDSNDMDCIKLWIVGDAEYYVKMENNYNDWVDELRRLIEEINKVDVSGPDFHASAKLRAMLLDAIRVIGDIMFFMKQKERVGNFAESTQEIDPQERDLLIQLLKGKLASPNA